MQIQSARSDPIKRGLRRRDFAAMCESQHAFFRPVSAEKTAEGFESVVAPDEGYKSEGDVEPVEYDSEDSEDSG